jgi:hypothetical protein
MPLRHGRPNALHDKAVQNRLGHMAGQPAEQLNALAGAAAPDQLEMEAPHEVYTLGLDQVTSGVDLEKVVPSGWRYMLRHEGAAVAVAQTMIDAGGRPAFAQFNSGPFVASTQEALGRAEEYAGGAGDADIEPRLLHVPALHALALWLHSGDGTSDVVLPMAPTPPGIDATQRYSVTDYLSALRQAAATVDPAQASDTTGG